MKNIITFLALIMVTTIFAQSPEKMSYQAVIRDAGNALVATQSVGMQISILKGGATSTAIYVETQTPSTNSNGLVSLEIGTGSLVSGDFTNIDWANDTYYIKTETDPTGGTTYTISGVSQLLSVPYALHAKTADNFTRTIPYATGNGPNDGTDVGQIVSRILNFTKKKANTKIRISYTDNLRTIGPNKSCRWQMRINGNACPSQDLVYDFFEASNGGNIHRSNTLVGYCDQVPVGPVQVQIWVLPSPGYSSCDCYTGFSNSTWVIEVEEVN